MSSSPTAGRRHSILGIAALAVAVIAVLVSAIVIPLSYLPEMAAAWALLFFTVPITVIMAAIAAVMAVVALVTDVRAHRVVLIPIAALVISAVTFLAPVLWFTLNWIGASSTAYGY